jgi:thiamine monophosphate kinase
VKALNLSGTTTSAGRLEAYLTLTPTVKEGEVISRSRRATSTIDVGDGLASDVGRICDQSGGGSAPGETGSPCPIR